MLIVAILSVLACLSLRAVHAASPGTWATQSIYFLMVDRFSAEIPSSNCDLDRQWCGGNLRAATDKLQYIKDLGFTAVWITPIVQQVPDNFFGYEFFTWLQSIWYQEIFNLVADCFKY